MIVTVTPAPAIDWTVRVDGFDLGAVNRIRESSHEPSGKGLNVSWALHRAGVPTRAIFPAGGHTGRMMTDSLTAAGLEHVAVDTGREVRTNITLVTRGSSTKINEPGTPLAPADVDALRAAVNTGCQGADTAVLCGSLPSGAPDDLLHDVTSSLRSRGVTVVVDSSGLPLRRALDAHPDLVKPNVDELADLTGRSIATFGDVVAAAEDARRLGARAVLASLGADGAMLVDDDGALVAHARDIPFVNSVGAGDALLAGFVGGGPDPAGRLANATLWAASAVAHSTTLFPIRDDFAHRITVHRLDDPGRPLREPSTPLAEVSG